MCAYVMSSLDHIVNGEKESVERWAKSISVCVIFQCVYMCVFMKHH